MSNKLQTVRESFFNTVFSLLGHIANCDGFINRNEIKRIETYMEKMDLTEKCKREAKQLFKAGSSPQFDINQVLKQFNKTSTPNLVQILLVYLISMARTDGRLVDKEMAVVQRVATELGYKSIVFDHLLRMISAQDQFDSPQEQEQQADSSRKNTYEHATKKTYETFDEKPTQEQKEQYRYEYQNQSSKKSKDKSNYYSQQKKSDRDLDDAYEALGVTENMSEKDIKRAYQKLVSQFHPDKLVGQGMPPDLVNAATERFKKIQTAFDYIKKHRHINLVA